MGEHRSVDVLAFETSAAKPLIRAQQIANSPPDPIQPRPHEQCRAGTCQVHMNGIIGRGLEIQDGRKTSTVIGEIEEYIPRCPVTVDYLSRQKLETIKTGEKPRTGLLQKFLFPRLTGKRDECCRVQPLDILPGPHTDTMRQIRSPTLRKPA